MRSSGLKIRLLSIIFCLSALAALLGAAWAALESQRLRHVAEERYGAAGLTAVGDWLRLVALAQDQPIEEKLYRINEFFNSRTLFRDDIEVWGQADYWATPLELMGRGRGDCEDYAIAKYISLLALGVPQASLRLIYVRARIAGMGAQAHMVLGYYPDPEGEPRILDNLVGSIEWASARADLSPVFSFNSEGLWAGGVRAASDPTERLSRWRDVLGRLGQEGFL